MRNYLYFRDRIQFFEPVMDPGFRRGDVAETVFFLNSMALVTPLQSEPIYSIAKYTTG